MAHFITVKTSPKKLKAKALTKSSSLITPAPPLMSYNKLKNVMELFITYLKFLLKPMRTTNYHSGLLVRTVVN